MKERIANLIAGLAGRSSRSEPEGQDPSNASGPAQASDSDAHYTQPMLQASSDVPNTCIPPHPDYLPVAVLEFEGPPGPVPVRRGETVIGRHSDDDIRVKDMRISRHHARLTADDGQCRIVNLTASRPAPNPMLVNGTDREDAEVVDGDVITLGGVSFTFRKAPC